VKARVVNTTPTMAQKWLSESNPHNRKIYKNTVEAYARDMKRGMWSLNNQGIGFDEDGELIDGQHRLTAIVWSGMTVPMLVVKGLPKNYVDGHKTQETVDRNKPRSIGDILTLSHGIENATLKSAVINVVAYLCTRKATKATPSIILEIMNIYGGELDAVMNKRKAVPGLIFAPVLGSFVFAAKVFKRETVEFEKKYFSGEELRRGDPPLIFRNQMLNRRNSGNKNGFQRKHIMDFCLTSLKYYIEQQPLNRLLQSNVGYDFFANKQKRTINIVSELFEY